MMPAVKMPLPYLDGILQNEEGNDPSELLLETTKSLDVELQAAHENYVPLILSVDATD